ncbi:MFS transporter [bacterium]|nr:MFS transporter [bacterium]
MATDAAVASPKEKSAKGSGKTLFALAFGYFIDRGEEQAISVLFPTLQQLWGLSYTNLGTIGTIRTLLQAIFTPVWGFVADRYSRKKVILFGTGLWGLWTMGVGFTNNFGQLLTVRAISGIGLGCLMPATFSLISDTYPPERRGRALGLLEGMGIFGIVIGTLGLGMLATPELWRWGFFALGGFSALSGLVVWLLVDEPVRGAAEPELEGKITSEAAADYRINFSDIPKVLRIPTIWVAIAQGMAGTMPWVIMGLYFITWLVNERGLDESGASIAFAGIVIGTVLSNIMGGFIGDYAEKVNPKYGRTIIGQFSIISGIPLTYYLLTQTENWSLGGLLVICLVTALFISWPGKGAKEPMMQGVTPPELRSVAYSVVAFIENGFSALVAIFAGSLADKIGLTEAMVWTIPVPWIACAVIFTFFYFTYPRDSEKLRAQMAERATHLR